MRWLSANRPTVNRGSATLLPHSLIGGCDAYTEARTTSFSVRCGEVGFFDANSSI
jgi:hypothetical protein